MSSNKAAAAPRGCLTARHWQDIRRAARLARSDGVSLIVHGVTVEPAARDKENLSQPQSKSTTTLVRSGRRQQPKEPIGDTCENPPAKLQHEQQPPRKQREDERSLRRLREFQQAIACGARWQPLVRKLLRKERAISRADVWTAHCSRNIELRNKMGDFFVRAMHLLRNKRMAIGDPPSPAIGALGEKKLRYFSMCLRVRYNVRSAFRVLLPIYTRNFISNYAKERHVAAAQGMLILLSLRNLLRIYVVARNQGAALASIIPTDTNNPCCHTLSDSPPQKPGAKRAKKPKGKGRR